MKLHLIAVAAVVLACGVSSVAAQTPSPFIPSGDTIGHRANIVKLSPSEENKLRGISSRYGSALHRARTALASKNYVAAQVLLKEALEAGQETFLGTRFISGAVSASESLKLSIALSEAFLADGCPQEAIRVLKENEFAPSRLEYAPNMAIAYSRLGKLDQAREHLKQVDAIRASFLQFQQDMPSKNTQSGLEANALLARAAVRYFGSRTMPDLQSALQLAPNNPVIAYHIASMYQCEKRYKEALPYLKIAAQYGTKDYAKLAEGMAGSIIAYSSPEQVRYRQKIEEETGASQATGAKKQP